MELNSRMKDFYDIYYLAMNYDFDGTKLQEAIFETLENRGRLYGKDTLDRLRLLKKRSTVNNKVEGFYSKHNENRFRF